jgi:pyridinium-3,5-biscarboxylic acid mononucleotide sulfurtransferase
VSPFRLARIERAEVAVRAALDAAGIPVRNLRVRDVGDRARIEVDADALGRVLDRPEVVDAALAAGFDAVELDRKGFRSGSMNERLADPVRYR